METDLMVIGAHPDDAELFCGGTIAKAVATGRKVTIVDLTGGERGTRGTPEEREAEGVEAGRILGAERVVLDCGDTLIENTQANRQAVIDVIRERLPVVVVTHDPQDRHPDHRKAHDLVSDAVFYAGVGGIGSRDGRRRPPLLTFVGNAPSGTPAATLAVDVTDYSETKLESVRAFRSQFFNESYEGPSTYIASERFWKTIESRARMIGAQIDVEFAEGFRCSRPLAIDDMVALFQ